MDTIKLLPQISREKLTKLFDDGTLRNGELDHKSVLTLNALSEPLQLKVIEHLETERLFLTNSRSKAGFLVSACEKAKRGELDARGFGALDPWRSQLQAECLPRPGINLLSPEEWTAKQNTGQVKLTIITPTGTCTPLTVGLDHAFSKIKDVIYESVTPDFSRSRLKLSHPIYGSLRDNRSPAYYNLQNEDCLEIKIKMRGGRKVNRQD